MSVLIEITAGTLKRAAVFPETERRRGRAPRSTPTGRWMEKLNLQHSYEKLMWLIAANFSLSDWFVSLTYDEDHLPRDRDAAVKRLKKFIRGMRRARKSSGLSLKYIYITEGQHGDKRLHHHIVLKRCPGDSELLRKLWPDGNVDWHPLYHRGYAGTAHYMTKEPRRHGRLYVGDRAWVGSRNLIRPKIERKQVPDGYLPDLPDKAFDVTERREQNAFGSFYYVDYKVPASSARK